MSKLFDDSDSDVELKTNNEYAKTYESWRKKEELNKLKTKYGEDLNESSSSSDEDDDGIELTEKVEKDFFKTLACLKNKDPRIYDEKIIFFDDGSENIKKEKKKEDVPVYLKDYERNIILEKGGILSDEEEDVKIQPKSLTYTEEQSIIKENLRKALSSVTDVDDEENWGGLFKERKKTKEEKEVEEADYKKWLVGQADKIDDEIVETELKPLKDYWNDPKLDEGEKFLRDYVLNKKFLDNEDEDYIPTYDEIIHDSDGDLSNDKDTLEQQETFEHKYNFRFEEPDQDFIKRYPRTMENSVRRKDDRRKIKRQETKERKKKEKEEKMKDLKKLQELKRKEIEEKLDKLKDITGNTEIGFEDEDIEGDFDPELHDKRMQALFDNKFYEEPEGDQKPEFPDLDEELEIENWDRYKVDYENEDSQSAPHCEDDNFNMDCDYDPHKTTENELLESSRSKKKRKRKSKFSEAVSKPKPKYDPNDKNYEQYFEEYYKLDCEDIIGDIPCRFKYREVAPNDFGLTTEEILCAKERELNRWCSLKKAIQIRPDHVEKYDQIAYKKKAQNINLKRKILPSLFSDTLEEPNDVQEDKKLTDKIEKDDVNGNENNLKQDESSHENSEVGVLGSDLVSKNSKKKNKNKVKKNKAVLHLKPDVVISNQEQKTKEDVNTVIEGTKKLKKKKSGNEINKIDSTNENYDSKKRKRQLLEDSKNKNVPRKKLKKDNSNKPNISDARLAAYGINPKKFKNKLKYGNT